MAPLLRVLTRLFRDADWYLHLSSLSLDIDLCFSFDRISYKRRLPIYYEDCLALPKHFPEMHQSFLNGGLVKRHLQGRQCCSNGSGFGKSLQQTSKIICWYYWLYRRKEAVCKWDLIKHEKAKYQNFMNTVCQMNEDDKYSLHYEFSDGITKADIHNIAALMKNVGTLSILSN